MPIEQMYVNNKTEVEGWLRRYGYLDEHRRLDDAVVCAQHFMGLREDGWAGPKTQANMSRPRCGMPDVGPYAAQATSAWPESCRLDLGVHCDLNGLGSETLTVPQMEELWYKAHLETMRVCNVKSHRVAIRTEADMYAYAGPTDQGVLAWAYFPVSCSQKSESRYGTRWNWTKELFEDTALHEQGHQYGIQHLPIGNVMYFQMERFFGQVWQTGDIAEFIRRYGKPVSTPIPNPPNPPGDPPVPLPPTFWDTFFPILIDLLRGCIAQGGEEQTIANIRNPGAVGRIRIRRALLKAGVPRNELSITVEQFIAESNQIPDEELRVIIAEVKENKPPF